MPRFILCGHHRELEASPCAYVSRHGNITYRADNCAVDRSEKEARINLEYFSRYLPRYRWQIEQLPARVPVSTAVLRAVPIDG